MDLLENIMKEKGADLLAELTGKAGYSAPQAEKFLPEAGSSVMTALESQASHLDLANLASQANVSALLKGIDVRALAGKAGVSAEQGTKGLTALLPLLLGFVSQKGAGLGGLAALLGGGKGGVGDALGTLKGLGGKLFG